ncbi:MAG: thioredoxin domain-containing protein, partial [Chloroflexi bacterium]|nr:thioredoxin domain-containing protein [Chloroflexota bacterium]
MEHFGLLHTPFVTAGRPHHFSPRPNRAHEIHWREWGPDAFRQAKEQDKPILLGISAVWCHWCHVMDETSYSDDEVIRLANERYVPIRVDNDQRPDVNRRYNLGGWPTTAFLSPDGEILHG